MKSLLEYFDPDKDSFEYTVKIALESDVGSDELQECIELALKRYDIVALEHVDTSPIQRTVEAFPNYRNIRVATLRVATEYPMSIQQIANAISDDLGVADGQVRIFTDYDPTKDNAESTAYDDEDDEDKEALLSDPDYSEEEELEEELHGNEFMEKNNDDIAEGSEERRASVRVWQSDLIPEKAETDVEKDKGVQYNHKESQLSPLSSVFLNAEKEYKNEEGQLSPLLRESINQLKIPLSEKKLLEKLIKENNTNKKE